MAANASTTVEIPSMMNSLLHDILEFPHRYTSIMVIGKTYHLHPSRPRAPSRVAKVAAAIRPENAVDRMFAAYRTANRVATSFRV